MFHQLEQSSKSVFSPLSVLMVWVYLFVLCWSVSTLAPKWSYVGINFFFPTYGNIIFTAILSIVPLIFLPKNLVLPSNYVGMYIYVFTFLPSVSLPFVLIKASEFNDEFYVFCLVFLLALIFLLKGTKVVGKPLVSRIKPFRFKVLPFVTLIVYGFALVLFVSTFGFKFSMPDFSDVYDIRAQYKEITKGSLLTRYFVGWMGYVVNIFLVLYGLHRRNVNIVVISFIFQMYIFSLMALKSHVATYMLAAMLFLLFLRFKTLSGTRFLVLVTAFILILALVDFWTGQGFWQMLVTRRIMVVPSQLMYYHFDFFNNNPKTYWAFSVLSNFVEYNYHLPPPNLIGEKHFGNPNLTAVVNLFIEGYSAFGYVGVFVATFILKWLLSSIDYVFVHKSEGNVIIIVLVLVLCNIINSTSVLTMMVSHGWLLLLLLISVFPWSVMSGKSLQ